MSSGSALQWEIPPRGSSTGSRPVKGIAVHSPFSYQRHTTDPAEMKRLTEETMRGTIPLYGAAVCDMLGADLQTRRAAVAFLDARNHPKVADLPRVVHSDALLDGADTKVKWMYMIGAAVPDPMAVLDLIYTSPVKCKFRLAFSFERYNVFLWTAAQTGIIHLHMGEPKPIDGHFVTLATQVQTEDLGAMLTQYALAELVKLRGGKR